MIRLFPRCIRFIYSRVKPDCSSLAKGEEGVMINQILMGVVAPTFYVLFLLSSPNHGNGTIPYWKKGKDRLWRYLFFPPIFHLLFFFVISFFSIHSWIFRLNRWISKTHQHVKPGAPSWLSWNGSFVGSRLATEHFSLRPHTFVPWDPFRGGVWEGWKNTFFASLSSSSSSSSCQIHWLNPSQ